MNMKKTLLSAAIAAGLGSPALVSAINVSTDAVGEALLFPYYSTMNGNQTFITVANTTSDAKAVKVRFREGVGSRDIMDFTLYLSAHDYWSATVFREGNNTRITTNDESCTVPDVKAAEPIFNDTRIPDEYDADTTPNRLSEGHLEILEMAVLDPTAGEDDVEEAVTHIDGVPEDCQLVRDWTAGVANNPFGDGSSIAVTNQQTLTDGTVTQDMLNPTGGLYGHAAVFNPNDGTYFTYRATALRGWAEAPLWFPQNATGLAQLAPYTTDDGLAFDEGEGGAGLVEYFDLPDLSTPAALAGDGALAFQGSQFVDGTSITGATQGFTGSIDANAEGDSIGSDAAGAKRDAVTYALMRASLHNDYITSEGLETEWVVTFPTRYLHVDFDNDADAATNFAVDPFTQDEDLVTGEACMTVGFQFWDREEGAVTDPGSIDFSPGGDVPDEFQLCFEVNVMAFNQDAGADTAVLKSSSIAKFVGLAEGFENGWARLLFTNFNMDIDESNTLNAGDAIGLPLDGFAAISDTTGAVPRGATYEHHMQSVQISD